MSSLAALAASPTNVFKPQSACAQQPASPRRIGVLLLGFSPENKDAQEFRQGRRNAGYSEGGDVVVEWRSARLQELVADLVKFNADVIAVESAVGNTGRQLTAGPLLRR